MTYYTSDAFLDVLVAEQILTDKQRRFIILNKSKQRAKILQLRQQKSGGQRPKSSDLDYIDIILSLNMERQGPDGELDLITEAIMVQAVSRRLNIPFKTLDPLELDMELVTKTISRSFAIKHLVLPVELRNGVLEVASYYPNIRGIFEDIERVAQVKVRPVLSTRSDIRKILSEFFGFQHSISAAESQFSNPTGGTAVDIGNLEQYVRISSGKELSSTDQHIKAAVNHLFNYALDQRASDIHIEPKREACIIRFRIDGILHIIHTLPKAVHSAITSRIKSLARMDIAEKRRPQDGRIKIGHGDEGQEVEVRVSTVPVAFGEKTVMRLLDPDVIFRDIQNLGFSWRDQQLFESFMTSPHGIVLVTGPTGSGKSTTLYSALKKIATPEKNIITVEEPVEMVHEEFNQIAVQNQIDVGFSTILRNILRQDPDVIMIGEIRDLETATHAVQAALTGHLVFSTLHTNDAVSTIVRLQDLGLESFLIGSTLLGVLAQRLVRKICPRCRETIRMDAQEVHRMGFPCPQHGELELHQGKGCVHCRGTGYSGRMGIFEVVSISDHLKKLITSQATDADLRQVAIREGMTTLREDAWRKVQNGLTTLEEALRVTREYI